MSTYKKLQSDLDDIIEKIQDPDIDVEEAVEVLGGDLGERGALEDTGVVHEDVDGAEGGGGLGEETLGVGLL